MVELRPVASPKAPRRLVLTDEAWWQTLAGEGATAECFDGGGFLMAVPISEFGVNEVFLGFALPTGFDLSTVIRWEVRQQSNGSGVLLALVACIDRPDGIEAVFFTAFDPATDAGRFTAQRLAQQDHVGLLYLHPRTGLVQAQEELDTDAGWRSDLRQALAQSANCAPLSPSSFWHLHEKLSRDIQGPATVPLEQIIAPNLPGRNDPCFCGSGLKFKRCCGSVN